MLATLEKTAITTLAGFVAARAQWDALFAADDSASVFLSYAWLHAQFTEIERPLDILVLQDDAEIVAALPLAVRFAPHASVPLARELVFASEPLGDYGGMLCRPGREEDAIAAFAAMLRERRWQRLVLADTHDARIALLARRIAQDGARLEEAAPYPCYAAGLPATYEAYLATLSKPTRRNTLRPMKLLRAELPHLRVSVAPHADADPLIAACVALNTAQWGAGRVRAVRLRAIYRRAFEAGNARFHVIWDGTHPVAGGIALVDPVHGVYGFALTGRDAAYDRYSPGKAVLGMLLEDAIAQGYRAFDFLRGDADYKHSYADREWINRTFVLTRRGSRTALHDAALPFYDAAKRIVLRTRHARHER